MHFPIVLIMEKLWAKCYMNHANLKKKSLIYLILENVLVVGYCR